MTNPAATTPSLPGLYDAGLNVLPLEWEDDPTPPLEIVASTLTTEN